MLLLANSVKAATLSLNSASKNYKTGQIITVNLILASADQAANALAVSVNYDSSRLSFQSASTADSLINFWVEKPARKNNSVGMQGVIFNPGYKGKSAKIVSLKFKAMAPGLTTISLTNFQVLANDGKGTALKTSVANLILFITGTALAEPEAVSPELDSAEPGTPAPKGLVVKSTTHPLQNSWYRGKLAKLSWTLPSGTKSASYSIDRKPTSDPGNNNRGKVLAVSYQDLTEGTWYFHIKVLIGKEWSSPAHYRLNFDNSGPTLSVSVDQSISKQAPIIQFSANDKSSGISHYEVKINNGSLKRFNTASSFKLNIPSSGRQHRLVVNAYDRAGNKTRVIKTFSY